MTTGYRPEIIQRAFVDFIGSRLYPFWSLTTPKLRLIARQKIDEELVALKFEVNQAFKRQAFTINDSWQGGQHIHLTIPIEGINHQRSYSLVGLFPQPESLYDAIFNKSAIANNTSINTANNTENIAAHRTNKDQCTTVTIAIKPQGLVSDYLTKQAPIGTVFNSSLPSGDFTLADTSAKLAKHENKMPHSEQSPLLFIAGGSGITPMLGLITQALVQKRHVTLLYYYRGSTTQAQTPFLAYWQHLATTYNTFKYHPTDTNDADSYLAGSRYLTAESLLALSLPLLETTIFACGSSSLLAGLYRALETLSLPADKTTLINKRSLQDNVIIERFGTALPDADMNVGTNETSTTADIAAQTVYLRGRQQQFNSRTTLLLGAEQAGLRLSYGCRQGICQLCRCQKISGVVKNIQTGKLSSNGYESIQTCINIPMTEVILDI